MGDGKDLVNNDMPDPEELNNEVVDMDDDEDIEDVDDDSDDEESDVDEKE